jgi:succinate-semialdehyde dehydrogenase/glutarate-semialdehyde dehydrogenase
MGNKLGPALLAGNCVVVKPAGTTPLTDLATCEIIEKAIQDAGGPKGVLNCVTGPGSVVGEELLVNPTVRKIGFTGATDTGRRVMQSAAADFKHVTLELGGSDPMIVCDDADIDRAVSAASVAVSSIAARLAWRSSGFTCSTASPTISSPSSPKKRKRSASATVSRPAF